jgi:hypothetical protein
MGAPAIPQGAEQRMAGQAPAELTDAAYQAQLAQGRADFAKGLQGSKQALTAEQAAFRAQIDKENADRAARLATRNEAYLARKRANQAAAKGGGRPQQAGGAPLTAGQLAQTDADRAAAAAAEQAIRTQSNAQNQAKIRTQAQLTADDTARQVTAQNAKFNQRVADFEKRQKERAALTGTVQQPPRPKQDNRVSAVKKARTVKQIQAAPVQQAAAAAAAAPAAAPAPSIGTVLNPSLM